VGGEEGRHQDSLCRRRPWVRFRIRIRVKIIAEHQSKPKPNPDPTGYSKGIEITDIGSVTPRVLVFPKKEISYHEEFESSSRAEWALDVNGHVTASLGEGPERVTVALDSSMLRKSKRFEALHAVIRRSTPLPALTTKIEEDPCPGIGGGRACHSEVWNLALRHRTALSFRAPWLKRHRSCAVVLNGATLRGKLIAEI